MSLRPHRSWSNLAVLGIGLAAIPAVAFGVANARRRSDIRSDNAPGFTARRSFGSFDVVGRSVTIRRPRAELFRFWRDFSNLSEFMENLEKVEPDATEAGRNTWFIRAPAGKTFAVETRVVREIDNELIAWRSTPESEIETEGRVTFEDAPGERGTRVGLIIAYKPVGGAAGKMLAKLMRRSPELQARHDLKRFKMLMETGEISTSARCRADRSDQQQAGSKKEHA
ncbi:SRPBCC family protein [Erythrobacter sp. NFXS35]|uniref:SRPBCC family protein n=1 Tax=Erythrobacter sp. NFXS35 TaxID=2818436 RepID=UPI0032DF310C